MTGNANAGVQTGAGGTAFLENSVISHNAIGVQAAPGSTAIIEGSVVSHNGIAIQKEEAPPNRRPEVALYDGRLSLEFRIDLLQRWIEAGATVLPNLLPRVSVCTGIKDVRPCSTLPKGVDKADRALRQLQDTDVGWRPDLQSAKLVVPFDDFAWNKGRHGEHLF